MSGLVRDVSYRLLVETRRRALHAMVAGGLALDPHADPEEAAAHFELGGDEAAAARWFARAAISARAGVSGTARVQGYARLLTGRASRDPR